MSKAAGAIGQFHRNAQEYFSGKKISFLKKYDKKYYLGCSRRTLEFSNSLLQVYPWLKTLCQHYEPLVEFLVSNPPTVIHAEYYGKNILFYNENVYPIDWQSAALAAGEIDLAALTEGWDVDVAIRCELEYKKTRWRNENPPYDFKRLLEVARLHLHFRWLGDKIEWTTHKNYKWRFEEIYNISQKLKLI